MRPDQQPSPPVKQYPELPVANLAPKRKSSPLLKLVLLVVILVIAAVVVWLVLGHKTAPPPAKQQSSTTKSQTSADATHINGSTSRFDSTDLFLGFRYPSDWRVNDPGSSTQLTVTSPPLTLKSAANRPVQGRIVMTIQNQVSSISQFAANEAIAPIESQKLTYSEPTPNQRAQTYLTAVNYGGASSSIDAFYITGDNGYAAGQYVPGSDIVKDTPLVSLTFLACAETACENGSKPAAIATNSWADSNLSKPLITMLESLTID